MKKINMRFTWKRIAFGVVLIILVGILVATGYYYFQFKGLKDRTSQIENRVNGIEGTIMPSESFAGVSDVPGYGIKYEVLSQQDREVRVQDTDAYSLKMPADGEIPYKSVKVKEVKLKMTNNSDMVVNFDGYSLNAQTKDGKLFQPVIIHPDDQAGETSFGLAPGGTSEGYIYLSLDKGEIVALYDTINSQQIKL